MRATLLLVFCRLPPPSNPSPPPPPVLEKNHYTFTVPSRASTNQHYIKSLDRIALGSASGTRTFASVSEVRKTTITARCMELIYNVLGKGIHITKRDLFYTDVKLFVKQADSDGVLDDIRSEAMWNEATSWKSLNSGRNSSALVD